MFFVYELFYFSMVFLTSCCVYIHTFFFFIVELLYHQLVAHCWTCGLFPPRAYINNTSMNICKHMCRHIFSLFPSNTWQQGCWILWFVYVQHFKRLLYYFPKGLYNFAFPSAIYESSISFAFFQRLLSLASLST